MSDTTPLTRTGSPPAVETGAALPSTRSTEQVEREIIEHCRLDPQKVAQVRALQQRHGSSFAEAAMALGLIGREHAFSALSKHYNYPILTHGHGPVRYSPDLVVGFEPFGPQAEAVRSTRAALISSAIETKTNSVAFIGPRSGVGVTYLCANIALSLAQAGVRTLIVDANLRRPRVGQMFGLDRAHEGLSDAINYRLADSPPIAAEVLPNLSVLPAGMTPPNPQELLASPEFVALAMGLRRRFGIVLFDTTSTEDCVDGIIVAARVGAAALVGRRHKTTFKDVRQLAESLRGQHCAILGNILDG